MTIENLLNPKLDYVFKRIFGYVGNEEITIGLLNSIIKEKVENIELDNNPILERDLLDDKLGILDIKAKINDNINCNIELQIVDNKDIEKRILFYWSKMYAQTIKKGKKYNELEKCIVILFSDYKLENLQKIKKYITKWNIREEENHQTILTEMLEIYILELEKYKESKDKNELDVWINFLKIRRE